MSPRLSTCPACGSDLDAAPRSPGLSDRDDPSCAACGHGVFFRIEPAGDVLVVHLQGRGIVTEQNVMRVLERVRYLIAECGSGRVLLDFEGVNYLSSTILGRLINLARLATDESASLRLCNLRPEVRDIFRLTRLEGHFAMHENLDDAMRAFRSTPRDS